MTFWVNHPSFSIPFFKYSWKIFDFIFPPRCAGCNTIGERFCKKCADQVQMLDSNICLKCGEPISYLKHDIDECKNRLSNISIIRSFSYYQPPLSSALRNLKYNRDIGIAEVLANYLVELYNKNKLDIDMVIPVPLSSKRIHERGYNQSFLLALPFSMSTKLLINKQSLRRVKDTQSQVKLDRHERLTNVNDAFIADSKVVKGKNILLIDDVSTTGATLEACASALKKAGANDIVAFTVARAVHTRTGFSDHL